MFLHRLCFYCPHLAHLCTLTPRLWLLLTLDSPPPSPPSLPPFPLCRPTPWTTWASWRARCWWRSRSCTRASTRPRCPAASTWWWCDSATAPTSAPPSTCASASWGWCAPKRKWWAGRRACDGTHTHSPPHTVLKRPHGPFWDTPNPFCYINIVQVPRIWVLADTEYWYKYLIIPSQFKEPVNPLSVGIQTLWEF